MVRLSRLGIKNVAGYSNIFNDFHWWYIVWTVQSYATKIAINCLSLIDQRNVLFDSNDSKTVNKNHIIITIESHRD